MQNDSQDTSEPQDQVLHEVDGIQEYDNRLPNWWLNTLYGAIAVAAVYWFWYESAHIGASPLEAYQAEVDRLASEQASQIKVGDATPEALVALSKDASVIALGKQVFTSSCVACHRADGGGSVGPNLTDEFWLHGGAPEKIFHTIAVGVAEKGMPAWQPQLGALKTQAVTAYVLGLRGMHAPGGKDPQGEREPLAAAGTP